MGGIKTFFSNNFETTETNEAEYTTHYYANDYNTTKNAVIAVGKQFGLKMTNVDDRYKEILLVSRTNGELIVTLNTISSMEHSVDIKVTTHYVIAAGRAKKKAKQFYEELNRQLYLKRKGGESSGY